MIADIPAEIRAARLPVLSRSVSSLRQKSFSCSLIYQTQVPLYLSVAGVSEKQANRLFAVCSSFKCVVIPVHCGTLSVFVQSFYHEQLLLPWKSGIEISVLFFSYHFSTVPIRDKYGDCPHRPRAATDIRV